MPGDWSWDISAIIIMADNCSTNCHGFLLEKLKIILEDKYFQTTKLILHFNKQSEIMIIFQF